MQLFIQESPLQGPVLHAKSPTLHECKKWIFNQYPAWKPFLSDMEIHIEEHAIRMKCKSNPYDIQYKSNVICIPKIRGLTYEQIHLIVCDWLHIDPEMECRVKYGTPLYSQVEECAISVFVRQHSIWLK